MSVRKYNQLFNHVEEYTIETEFPSVAVPVFLVKSGSNFYAAEYASHGEIVKYNSVFTKVGESSNALFGAGLEKMGDYLYYFVNFMGAVFARIDTDLGSSEVVTCNAEVSNQVSNVLDIYSDGVYWYIALNDGSVLKVNMGDNGEIEDIVETIDISDTLGTTIINVRKQGNYWYVVSSSGVGGKTATIYKFDLSWEYTGVNWDLSGDLDSNEYLGCIASGD